MILDADGREQAPRPAVRTQATDIHEFVQAVLCAPYLECIHAEATRGGDTETADAAMRLLISVDPERAERLAST